MKFIPTDIPDVVLIEPQIFKDVRGAFFESYNQAEFSRHGIGVNFVQDNRSVSRKGVVRGLHYQIAPQAQAKLVQVIHGEAFDVVVDIRKESKTYGRWVGHKLSAENKKMLYAPEGFAHGFCALTDDTEFFYKVSSPYSPKHERGIVWNDPALGIEWPAVDSGHILSQKDQTYPTFREI